MGMMRNLSGMFTDTRTRTIFIVTGFLIIAAVAAGFFGLRGGSSGTETKAKLTGVPSNISSIPGSANPTAQYARYQQQQNVLQAKTAKQTGKSAIPTIIRTEKLAKGQRVPTGAPEGGAGVGFRTLSRLADGGAQKSLWLSELRKSKCSRASIDRARAQGAGVDVFREAGCRPKSLINAGFSLGQLKAAGYTATDLRQAGYNAAQLKAAGYDAKALRQAGFSACEMKTAGFTAAQLAAAGYTRGELRGAGFAPAAINTAFGAPGVATVAQIREAGCSVDALIRQRAAGITAAAIREAAGCNASALKAAGYTAAELRAAGFTAKELRDAGFTLAELKAAGYSLEELLAAGYTLDELRKAGFDVGDIKAAEKAAKLPGGYTNESLKAGGCGIEALKKARAAGVSAKQIRDIVGCDASSLRPAGFSAAELNRAGFSAKQLKDAGYSARDLRNAGFSAKELSNAGYTAATLKKAGYTPTQLRNAGFNAQQLKNAGLSANELKQAGYNADDLTKAGFGAKALRAAGFKAGELKKAGLSDQELKAAGFTAAQLKALGLAIADLLKAGFLPSDIETAGYSTDELQAAGLKKTPEAAQPKKKLTAAEASDAQLQKVLAAQAKRISDQRLQQELNQRQSAMAAQAGRLLASWKPTEQVFVPGVTDEKKPGQAGAAGGAAGQAGAAGVGVQGAAQAPAIKAGKILFAVLDTAVNSDEPGPVLATVVQGKYKGARLIGTLTRPENAKRVILTFNLISLPDAPRSVPVNAVAIDPNTARIAVANKVNSHYLMRYGSLFASSFLEGFGQSFQSEGTKVSVDGGTVEVTDVGRSLSENAVVGLAKVGQRWGAAIAPQFNRPPTIRVYSGVGLGILFQQDVVLPKS